MMNSESNLAGSIVQTARTGASLLWVKTELLHPVDKGGRIRSIEMLKRLKQHHHITYLTLDDGTSSAQDRRRSAEYCDELVCVPFAPATRGSFRFKAEALLNMVSPLPYAIARYRSAAMRRAVAEHAARCDVVVYDFLVAAVNHPGSLTTPKVLFQHNVEAEIWRRHADNQTRAVLRLFFKAQWAKMRRFEARTCRSFGAIVAVSEDDCATLKRDYGVGRVAAVPTGVDTDFFRPSGRVAPRSGTVVFTGSMDWMPNDDAIRYFVAEIMPQIARSVGNLRLVVVGREPSSRLMELARGREDIVFTGRVPDVRPAVEEAVCFIVPIRIGGGTRLKIFEAMAMEKPVVSTTIGAEGLPVVDGRDLLLADTPSSFADAVVRVLQDGGLADRLGRQAAATVRAEFGWDRVARRFSVLCEDARAAPTTGLP